MARGQRDWSTVDAVTIDAYGTLLELRDPVGSLARVLPEFDRDAIDRAFGTEVEYYTEHAVEGRDASSLGPEDLVDSLEFTWVDGAREAIERLRARGLALAVVSNWDVSLHEVLERCGLAGFGAVLTSAEEGTAKPAPDLFLRALDRLGVAPAAALHAGDSVASAAP